MKKLSILFLAVICAATVFAGDISVTGSNVLASPSRYGSQVKLGTAGQTITAGQALYQALTTSGSMMLLSATTSNSFTGIALNNAAAGQPVSYVVYDPNFTTGATHNIGDVICTSTNAGYLCPAADVTGTTHHGNFVTVLGVATSASTVFLNPTASGTSSP